MGFVDSLVETRAKAPRIHGARKLENNAARFNVEKGMMGLVARRND
jgi:hypothetical protein